jgi:predicted metal-dependent hydrolase
VLAGADAARLADELLRAGRPFHAHEVLEASWKSGPAQERDLWQGLAQVAVGLTHAHRGNARGAVALLRRGSQRVRAYQARAQPAEPYGIDIAAFLAASENLATRIEQDGLSAIQAADLAPGLRRPDP